MITSNIGKIFLKAYNEKCGTNYDAKTFFIEQYYPIIYQSNKYAQWVTNSPFVQGLESSKSGEFGVSEIIKDSKGKTKIFSNNEELQSFLTNEIEKRKDLLEIKEKKLKQIKILKKLDSIEQNKLLKCFINKVESSEADASIAIGYPTLDINATTSGQVTNLKIDISKDDVYLSWIGAGLGVGLQGGYSILFDNALILLDLFEGWKVYRTVLNETQNLKGNQINTWNGQWLTHRYSKLYVSDVPMADFNPFSTKDGLMNVEVQSWTRVLIAISQKFGNPQMMGYVYNYGQTNTTIGFIPFVLAQIRRPVELYQHLFGMDSAKKAEPLWGTAFGFANACQAGAIGVRAMEPKGLTDYIMKGRIPKLPNNEEQQINFNTYQIWILAMLNNEELWAKAQQFAQELQSYASAGDRGKKVNSNKVSAVLETTNKQNFIKSLVDVISDAENKENIETVVALVNKMQTDNVPYFLTLIRFHYAAINNTKK